MIRPWEKLITPELRSSKGMAADFEAFLLWADGYLKYDLTREDYRHVYALVCLALDQAPELSGNKMLEIIRNEHPTGLSEESQNQWIMWSMGRFND